MDVEALFLRTLDDLEICIKSSDDYTILRASALLRKLLLDGERLMDAANRPYKFKFKFEVIDTDAILDMFKAPGMPQFEFVGIQDALEPDVIPNPPRKVVNRDIFLNLPVQLSKDKSFSVREIILHQANIEGGVHHALEPRCEKDKVLSETEDSLRILGLPSGLRQLKYIGQVTIKALFPLRMALLCARAIKLDPNDAAAYYNRGIVYAQHGKLEEAITDFKKAIECGVDHPQIADCYYNRGHTRMKLAILDFEQYVKLAPDSQEKEIVRTVLEQLKSGGW